MNHYCFEESVYSSDNEVNRINALKIENIDNFFVCVHQIVSRITMKVDAY